MNSNHDGRNAPKHLWKRAAFLAFYPRIYLQIHASNLSKWRLPLHFPLLIFLRFVSPLHWSTSVQCRLHLRLRSRRRIATFVENTAKIKLIRANSIYVFAEMELGIDCLLRAAWIAVALPILVAFLPFSSLDWFRGVLLGFARRGKILQSSSQVSDRVGPISMNLLTFLSASLLKMSVWSWENWITVRSIEETLNISGIMGIGWRESLCLTFLFKSNCQFMRIWWLKIWNMGGDSNLYSNYTIKLRYLSYNYTKTVQYLHYTLLN